MTPRAVLLLTSFVLSAVVAGSMRAQAPLFESPDPLVLPNGSDFQAFTVGDIDGDGDARDVVGVGSSNEVLSFRSTGNATWAAPIVTNSSQIASVWDVELADVDGDGDLDLVVANSNVFANSVTVLRNTGSGAFAPQNSYPVGGPAINLALADYDLDSDVDIAVTLRLTGSQVSQFKLLKNNGNGTYAAALPSPVGPAPSCLLAMDTDLDGDMDLVFTQPGPNHVRVCLNAGDGTFPTSMTYAAGADIGSLCALDVDGDGDLDLAGGGLTGISVLTRASDGTFPTYTTYPIVIWSHMVAFDADGDGDDDIAGRTPDDHFAIVKVSGGVLQATTESTGSAYRGIEPADFDADGDVDLLIAGWGTLLMRNGGNGQFFQTSTQPTGQFPQSVRLGDLDADGDLDAACVNGGDATATVLWNSGDGSWGSSLTIPIGTQPYELRLADLDGDLDLDLVVAGSGSGLMVVLNLGGGSFGPVSIVPSAGGANGLDLADLDADGDLDAIVASYVTTGAPSIRRYDNAGNGTFGAPTTLGTLTHLRGVAIGDLNADGEQDIVFARSLDNAPVTVLFGLGGGTFTPPHTYALSSLAWSLDLADLDADGDLDIGTRSAVGWRALLNDGNGAMTIAHVVPNVGFSAAGLDPGHVLTDLDDDGHLDVVLGMFDWAAYALGRGDGTFDPPQQVGVTVPDQFSLAVGDLDRDGDSDAVYASDDHSITLVRGCRASGLPICAGDGSAASCPCGNASAPGSATGCANSFGLGGSLRGSGRALLSDDRMRLDATDLPPSATALYFQGTTSVAGGQGAAFGDGLRCVGGSVIRLGTKVSAGGASSYPGLGDSGLVVHGAIATSGSRLYQVWYRNSAAFCTASTFNLTNALSVIWNP